MSKKQSKEERFNFGRKHFVHGDVLMTSSRTEEGLPLPPNYLINMFIEGIIAKAQSMYKVRVCHFIFLSNHFHIILVVENPTDVPKFVGYVKCELSHVINKLMGRRKKTIWCRKYDSPKFLLAEDIKKYIKYLYLNPAANDLETSIENYPGVGSWKMISSGKLVKKAKKISRRAIKPLHSPAISIAEQKELVQQYKCGKGTEYSFVLEPNAWAESFPGLDVEAINKEILEEIKEQEANYEKARKTKERTVVGVTKLRRSSMAINYTPSNHGQKMTVICSDVSLRAAYLSYFKGLCVEAYKVFKAWKKGLTTLRIPEGMFPPAMPTLVSALPWDF